MMLRIATVTAIITSFTGDIFNQNRELVYANNSIKEYWLSVGLR
jgi:hypothetical protein